MTSPANAAASLRPLGVGEILDAAVKICLRHWRPLIAIAAVVTIPITVLIFAVVASAFPVTTAAAPSPEEAG